MNIKVSEKESAMSVHSGPLDQVAQPCDRFNLPIPPEAGHQISPDKLAKIARIRLQFSIDVANLHAKSLGEVLTVLGDPGAS